jgi:hypothetical protein
LRNVFPLRGAGSGSYLVRSAQKKFAFFVADVYLIEYID